MRCACATANTGCTMTTSDAPRNLAAALRLAFQAAMPVVPKSKSVNQGA